MKEKIRCSIGIIQSNKAEELYIQRIKEPYLSYFEFPGGKIKEGESPKSALIREFKEELSISVKKVNFVGKVFQNYPEFEIILYVFFINTFEGKIINSKRKFCYKHSNDLEKGFKAIGSCMKVLKLSRLSPNIGISSYDRNPFDNSYKTQEAEIIKSYKMMRFRDLDQASPAQLELITRFIKSNSSHYIIDHPFEELFNGAYTGIHYKSKYLYTLKSIPENLIVYSGSCHSLEEVEHANRLNLDYIIISPVKLAKYKNQEILGWDGFKKLTSKARMPTYALGGMNPMSNDYDTVKKNGGFGIAGIKKFW